ncbi:MAG: hypothetical protein FWH34_01720 [Desulfovibrionaceae bacterium]|nr:hypothetical protein [Desulfovibrionaceae bacterium]
MRKYLLIHLVVLAVSFQSTYSVADVEDELRNMRQLQEMQLMMQMQQQSSLQNKQSDEYTRFIASMQRMLAADGYYSGPIDGIAGPRTEAAFQARERDMWTRDPEGYCKTAHQGMEKGDKSAFLAYRRFCVTR